MKNSTIKILGTVAAIILLAGCSKYDEKWNYPGGVVSPYIAIYDVRNLYKGTAVELNPNILEGSSKVTGLVVSDHRQGNLPEGLLIVQNNPRLNFLRGLAFSIGADAANYLPGDSVVIDLDGTRLERVDGMLQVTNLSAGKVEKVGTDKALPLNRVNADRILANPGDYESTLIALVKGGFVTPPASGAVMSGVHELSDGFGVLPVVTEASSPLASHPQYPMANYIGIVYTKAVGDSIAPYFKPRTEADITQLNSVYEVPPIIITGWHNDPRGGDANYEYIQLMATEDIDFSVKPFSLVTTNNAGSSTPGGPAVNGWAMGGTRTYKFNLTSGFAAKGSLFYVGGTGRRIDASGSTSISSANWIAARAYNSTTGQDFGNTTTNLLANSGNAYGVAVFTGTTVTKASVPVDVLFVGTGGSTSIYDGTNGYRICNNDFYDIINPITLDEQPFYRSGSNLTAMAYNTPSDQAFYNSWQGEYNMKLKRWTKARSKIVIQLTDASLIEEIENPENLVKLVE